MNAGKHIFLTNENKWIVTDKNYQKLLLAKENVDELQEEIKRVKVKNAVILFVPPFDTSLTQAC